MPHKYAKFHQMRSRGRAMCDFMVKYDPDVDKPIDLTKRILYSIFVKHLKNKKPRIVFVSGDSGEGKTMNTIMLQILLCEIQGIDFNKYMEAMNVFTPLEYPIKLKQILYQKEYRKCNIITLHEARDVIRSTEWNTFITQAVADVNAQARAVKRLVTFIISQFIRDITKEMRYTLNYYIKVRRPLGRHAKMQIFIMWKDDQDLETPRIRKRKLQGYIINKNGKRVRYIPKYLELHLPPPDIKKKIELLDREAKVAITSRKIDKMIKELHSELDYEYKRVDDLVKFYMANIHSLNTIGRRRGKNWRMNPQARELLNLSAKEGKEFEYRLNDKLNVSLERKMKNE